jgi:hypothetical protein
MVIDNKEISIKGKFFRIAKLYHEWYEFLDEPEALIEKMKKGKPQPDLFTFVQEAHVPHREFPFHRETVTSSILTIKSFDDWWDNLHFKARNKARKAQKTGVEICETELNDSFVRGVEKLYNECPLRQGRKFTHYGKNFNQIKNELGSFIDRSIFTGAYFNGELIGFMKTFQGNGIFRIIHILAMLAHRDKCVMDALIAHAVKLCDEKSVSYLHYGDWTSRGLGAFRSKYNFQPQEGPRYFVPLTARGKFMLSLRLHRPLRERLPQSWADRLIAIRNYWNAMRYGTARSAAEI